MHPDGLWDSTHELLAGIIQLVDVTNRMLFSAHFKGTAPKPIEIRRPGEIAENRRPTRDDFRQALLGG